MLRRLVGSYPEEDTLYFELVNVVTNLSKDNPVTEKSIMNEISDNTNNNNGKQSVKIKCMQRNAERSCQLLGCQSSSFLCQFLQPVCLQSYTASFQCTSPSWPVFSEHFPLVDFHTESHKIPLRYVFATQHWRTTRSGSGEQLSINNVFREAAVGHSAHVPKPS